MPMRSLGLVVLACFLAGCGETRHAVLAPQPALSQLPAYYSVEYDSLFQTPRFVRNLHATGGYLAGAPAPFSNAEAFQIVRNFVTRYAPVFHFRPGTDGFVVTHADGGNGQNFVKITQTYLGLRVEPMGYGTSVLSSGEVGSMIGRFMPDIHLLTTPLIASETAAATSVAALDSIPVTVYSAPERMIQVGDDFKPRLVWSTVVVHEWLTWTVFVDAQTGKVVSVRQNFIIN
jgi:hypothetical protein